jgi:hypothetical protein
MKKVIFILSLTVLAVVGLNNNSFSQTEQPVVEDGPILTLDKEVHDYGTINQGDDGKCIFTITNTGNEALIISLCKGSCGCTVPSCPQEPIAPGATAEIAVKYDTKRVGPINKSVTITSNSKGNPRQIVRIKGNVKAKPQGSAPINTGGPTSN